MLFAYTGPNQLKFVSKLDIPSEQKVVWLIDWLIDRLIDSGAHTKCDEQIPKHGQGEHAGDW